MDVYGAREDPVPGVTGALVADAVPLPAGRVLFEPSWSAAAPALAARARPGDLVLTMGAGDVSMVGPEVLAALRREPDGTEARRGEPDRTTTRDRTGADAGRPRPAEAPSGRAGDAPGPPPRARRPRAGAAGPAGCRRRARRAGRRRRLAAAGQPVLAVRTVQVDGVTTLPADQVREAAGIADGHAAAAGRRRRRPGAGRPLPQVASVEVTRGWPHTVVVTVVERVPVAVVGDAGQRSLVDAEGVLFDTVTGAPPAGRRAARRAPTPARATRRPWRRWPRSRRCRADLRGAGRVGRGRAHRRTTSR